MTHTWRHRNDGTTHNHCAHSVAGTEISAHPETGVSPHQFATSFRPRIQCIQNPVNMTCDVSRISYVSIYLYQSYRNASDTEATFYFHIFQHTTQDARYVNPRVAHAPGMPGTFTPPLQASDPAMQHGTRVTHVPWCMPWSLTSSFLWGRWRGKRSRHSRRMRNRQFYVSGKRSIGLPLLVVPHTQVEFCHWL